jgi:hypothetical protein
MKTNTNAPSEFNADAPVKVDSVKIVWEQDENSDFDSYNDKRTMQGCHAVAIVSRPIGQGSRRLQTFQSSGLWGIESDLSDDYRREVESEQLDDLREHLAAFGIDLI